MSHGAGCCRTASIGIELSVFTDWPNLTVRRNRLSASLAQIVEILNGGNPAEMPCFQESHWELVINIKAAKELGLEIPAGLVARADRVIE